MQKLLQGVHRFRQTTFQAQRELFERLARGQKPETLFITCSDSRIDPALLTGSEVGDLFVLRNAGNIVPSEGMVGGELATVEFAVKAIGVRDIVVCGHTDCGAMRGLMQPEAVEHLLHMREWLSQARETKAIIDRNYGHLHAEERIRAAAQENVLVQIERLSRLPFIAERVDDGRLRLHGWMYKFESGEVFGYHAATGQFEPLYDTDTSCVVVPR